MSISENVCQAVKELLTNIESSSKLDMIIYSGVRGDLESFTSSDISNEFRQVDLDNLFINIYTVDRRKVVFRMRRTYDRFIIDINSEIMREVDDASIMFECSVYTRQKLISALNLIVEQLESSSKFSQYAEDLRNAIPV